MSITTVQILEGLKGNSLDLSYKKITKNDVRIICEFLDNNPYVTSLNLYENNIGRKGAELLAKNKTLESLDIGENSIEDEGAQAFETNNTLKSLKLEGNMLRKATAVALARNKTLTALDINFNHIRDEGVKALAENKTLKFLAVGSNFITDAGIRAFTKNTTLSYLHIGGTDSISSETINVLKANTRIKISEAIPPIRRPLNLANAEAQVKTASLSKTKKQKPGKTSKVKYLELALQNAKGFFNLFKEIETLQFVVDKHPQYKDKLSEALIAYSKVNNDGVSESINQLMQSSSAFIQLAELFPEKKQQLFAIALPKFSSLASSTKDLINLGKLCEDSDMDDELLEKAGLGTPEFSKKWFASCSQLIDLANEFPFHKSALIRPIKKDLNERLRLINSRKDLCRLAEAFPKHKSLLIRPLLKDPNERLRLIDSGNDLCELAASFPDHRDELIRPLLKDPIERSRFTAKDSWDVTRGCDNLCAVAKLFPEYRAELIQPFLTDSNERLAMMPYKWQLLELTEAFPDSRSELIKSVYTDAFVRKQIIEYCDDFIHLIKKYPDHKDLLLDEILKDPTEFSRVIDSVHDLLRLLVFVPNHKEALILTVLKDVNRSKIIKSKRDLCRLAEAFPEQRDDLIKSFFKNPKELARFITCKSDFEALTKAFPQHEKALAQIVRKDAVLFQRVIKDRDDIYWIMQHSPNHHQQITHLVLENKEIFESVTTSPSRPYTIGDLLCLFPKCKELIFSKVVLSFAEIIRDSHDLSIVARIFPAHQYDLLNWLFTKPEVLKEFISDDLNSLLNAFPKQRQKIMLFAARCAPNLVLENITAEKEMDNEQRIDLCIKELERGRANKNKASAEIKSLQKAFEESNKMLTPFQRRSYAEIRDKYIEGILNLMIALSPERALAFLTGLASKSVMRLEQFLTAYKLITDPKLLDFLNLLMNQFAATLTDKKSTQLWHEILVVLSVLSAKIKTNEVSFYETILRLGTQLAGASLQEVRTELSSVLKKLCIDSLGVDVDCNDINQDKLNVFMGSRFSHLLMVNNADDSDSSDENAYDYWYKAMLKCDITDQPLDEMVHDCSQNDTKLRVIAEHNANIRKQFYSLGLNPEKVTHYKRTHPFTYTVDKNKEVDWKKLGTDILNCLNTINANGHKELKLVEKIVQELTKGKNAVEELAKRIQSPAIETLFKKLTNHLGRLKESSFNAGKEVKESLTTLEQLFVGFFDSKKPVVKHYYVQQWDKSRNDTFFLGNYLNCCLKASGEKFNAIIERRLDDAMPVHVVMDSETNEPICGAWLFWAKDKSDDTLKLVVNFLEIGQDYGNNESLMNTLVANLLHFTAELYAKDVILKGTTVPPLIIRRLNYGNIPDCVELDDVECSFPSKVGGFCNTPAGDPSSYYLAALGDTSFHLYSSEGLRKQYPKVIIPKNVPSLASDSTFFGGNNGNHQSKVGYSNDCYVVSF